MIGCDVTWLRDTWFTEYQWPSSRRDLVNSEPQMVNSLYESHVRKFQKHVLKIRV